MTKKTAIFLISLISITLTMILGAWAVARTKDRLVNNLTTQYLDQERLIGQEVANLLENEVLSMQDKLQAIALLPTVRSGEDTDECNASLAAVAGSMKVKINNLGRVNAAGKFVCSLNPALIGQQASNLGQYITDIFLDPKHEPVMSRAIKVPGVEGFIFAVHIPVFKSNGEFDGTLGGAIYFNYLQETYLKNVVFAETGYINIIDDNFDILYHPNTELIGKSFLSDEVQGLIGRSSEVNDKLRAAAAQGEIGTLDYQFNGERKIAIVYPIEIFPGRRWMTTVTVPVADIENNLLSSGITRYFIGLTIFILIMIAFTPLIILWYMIRAVFRPISRITASIKNLSKGNFEQHVLAQKGSPNDELNQLISAFNGMASQLKDLYQNLNNKVAQQAGEILLEKNTLEKKISERTSELKVAKENLEQEVVKQTAELRQSLEDVQRVNALMLDREKKMIELKDRIAELEQQIEADKKDAAK